MDINEIEKSKAHITVEIIEYVANSVVIKTIWLFLVSSVQVLARGLVETVWVTAKFDGEISLMIVRVPSPWELNASMV